MSKIETKRKSKRHLPNQKQSILSLLRNRKSRGATNVELSKLALCYQTRIFELVNEEGCTIDVKHLGNGLVKYVLVSEGEPVTRKPVYDKVIEAIKSNGNSVDSVTLRKILQVSNANVCKKSVKRVQKV